MGNMDNLLSSEGLGHRVRNEDLQMPNTERQSRELVTLSHCVTVIVCKCVTTRVFQGRIDSESLLLWKARVCTLSGSHMAVTPLKAVMGADLDRFWMSLSMSDFECALLLPKHRLSQDIYKECNHILI
jgi:hypothetical protein